MGNWVNIGKYTFEAYYNNRVNYLEVEMYVMEIGNEIFYSCLYEGTRYNVVLEDNHYIMTKNNTVYKSSKR